MDRKRLAGRNLLYAVLVRPQVPQPYLEEILVEAPYGSAALELYYAGGGSAVAEGVVRLSPQGFAFAARSGWHRQRHGAAYRWVHAPDCEQ